MIMNLLELTPFLQMCLSVGNLCIMLYALKTFLNKPHDDLKEKVNEHEVKIKEIEKSLQEGNDRFREQEEINKMFKTVIISFVDFEIAYCQNTGYAQTEDLKSAKKALQDYLAKQ